MRIVEKFFELKESRRRESIGDAEYEYLKRELLGREQGEEARTPQRGVQRREGKRKKGGDEEYRPSQDQQQNEITEERKKKRKMEEWKHTRMSGASARGKRKRVWLCYLYICALELRL